MGMLEFVPRGDPVDNARGPILGQSCSGLRHLGHQQTEAEAAWVPRPGWSHVRLLASDLQRAPTTSKHVEGALGCAQLVMIGSGARHSVSAGRWFHRAGKVAPDHWVHTVVTAMQSRVRAAEPAGSPPADTRPSHHQEGEQTAPDDAARSLWRIIDGHRIRTARCSRSAIHDASAGRVQGDLS